MIIIETISSKKPLPKINRIALFILGCFGLILVRLIHLQIYKSDHLTTLSTNNFTRLRSLPSQRGNICDCQYQLLATNRPLTNLVWNGSGKRQFTTEQHQTLERLANVANIELSPDLLQKLQIAERLEQEFVLCEDISFTTLSKIEEQFPNHPNLVITSSLKRFYPHKKLASHVIGYLGTMNLSKEGKMGLERLFDNSLKGIPGTQKLTINSLGKRISDTEIAQTVMGDTIVTTLNLELQKIAEKSFEKPYSGSMIVMDPRTGAILTLLSRPNFNPTIFLESFSDETWTKLRENKPFINRALTAAYPPASIFKLVTVASGLELGLINPDSYFKCNGHVMFGDRRYHCNNHTGHGVLTIKEALAQSCNILFYRLGKTVSIDLLADYAKRFGLGSKTGIILPENEGLIPTSEWKRRTKGERWWVGETLSASIGQSYILVTPMQIARMISALFEGHLVQPRILVTEPIIKQKLEIKLSTLQFLQESMKLVVTTGTGRRVDKIADLTIYAKTGTAQTCSLEKDKNCPTDLEHAWFVSNFSYKKEAPLTIVILVENAGSTRIAINIAKKFFTQYRQLMATKLKSDQIMP